MAANTDDESAATPHAPAPKRKRYASQAKTSHWAVTLNPKDDEEEPPAPPAFDEIACRYMVTVKHEAEKEHWHLYIQFRGQKTMNQVKEFLQCYYAHCEPVKATESYEKYLNDGHTTIEGPTRWGVPIRQGHRSDFERLVALVKQGSSEKQIYEDQPALLRYPTAVSKACDLFTPDAPIRRAILFYLLWGPTDTGKTYRARMHYPQAWLWRGKYVEGKTFDTYNEETTIILDEWTFTEWPLTTMNALTDEWVSPLQCRYKNKKTLWNRIIITTNDTPEEIYRNMANRDSFFRRITRICRVSDKYEDMDIFDVIPSTPDRDVPYCATPSLSSQDT